MILRSLAMMALLRAADDGAGGGGGEPKTVPVEALQAERAKAQEAVKRATELEQRLAAIEAGQKKAEEESAKKRGEYETLYGTTKAELEAKAARLAELEAGEQKRVKRIAERNSERLKALPETAQAALKPIAAAMSPDDFADYLESHGSAFGVEGRFSAGTRVGAGGKAEEPIPPEASTHWQKFGKHLGTSERDWYEKTWKPMQKKTA